MGNSIFQENFIFENKGQARLGLYAVVPQHLFCMIEIFKDLASLKREYNVFNSSSLYIRIEKNIWLIFSFVAVLGFPLKYSMLCN